MKLKKTISLILLLSIGIMMFSGCETNNQDEITGNVILESENTADADKVVIYFFWGGGCEHCAAQKPFMMELKNKYPEVELRMYETWSNPENAKLFSEIAKAYGTEARGVPATFIGEKFWIGFSESMKGDMIKTILECIDNKCIEPSEK
jgi:thiol-disulfide isomerase/thioredoxin